MTVLFSVQHPLDLLVIDSPLRKYPSGGRQLGLFSLRVITQINGLGLLLGLIITPGLTPEPFLRQ